MLYIVYNWLKIYIIRIDKKGSDLMLELEDIKLELKEFEKKLKELGESL